MDSIQKSMADLLANFNERMENFEGALQKETTSSSTISSLSAEFLAFKTFTLNTLKVLQQQIELLHQTADQMEMQRRKKILLLHGVTEDKQEDVSAVISKVIISKLRIDGFTAENIKRCHRMGKAPSSGKPRPILFKLSDTAMRDKIWTAKTKLKGSGITLTEFLTKNRHNIFMQARRRFGVSKCWTKNGAIFVLGSDKTRHQIRMLSDLDNSILQPSDDPAKVVPAVPAAPTSSRSRRATSTARK